jgi:hypothetical protein
LLALLALASLSATAADGSGPVSGAAAGGTSSGADGLEHCDKTLGVLRIDEDTNSNWYRYYGPRLGPTTPLLNLMIMQSNCFVVVERGTGERALNAETQRARGDEARESATRGKGQQVVADFLMKPEIIMAKKDNEGGNLALGKVFGKVLGGVTAGMKSSEAGAVLTLVDIRSTVRLAAAEGHAKDSSFRIGGGGFAGGVLGGGSAFSNTDEGKLITAAFADAYNKMVVALRQYKAQKVEGGLGEGGSLGVQGGSTKSSKAVGN